MMIEEDRANLAFVFIAPLQTGVEPWLAWRRWARKSGAGGAAGAVAYGQDTALVPSVRGTCPPDAGFLEQIRTAIIASRVNSGWLHRLPGETEGMRAAFDVASGGSLVAAECWLLASRRDGPALVYAVELRATPSAAPFTQVEACAVFDDFAFGGQDTRHCAEALGMLHGAGVTPADAHIVRGATQLLTLLHGDSALSDGHFDIHMLEEGDAQNHASRFEAEAAILSYFHVGWGNTTAAGTSRPTLASLVPIAIAAQSAWFLMRELRANILDTDFDTSTHKIAPVSRALASLEGLRLQLHLWGSEIVAFRNALVPWQLEVYAAYLERWSMTESYADLTRLVENSAQLFKSAADRFERRAQDRQANVLAVIAIIQIIGIAGSIAGYFQLAEIARLDVSGALHAGWFAWMVAAMPAMTAMTIIGLLVLFFRRK